MKTAVLLSLLMPVVAATQLPVAAQVTRPIQGQIQLDGEVRIVDVPRRRLVLNVTSFTLPSGKSAPLAKPKLKTVTVEPNAVIWGQTGKQGAFQAGSVYEWSTVAVIGLDVGGAGVMPASHIRVVKPAVLQDTVGPIPPIADEPDSLKKSALFGFDDEVVRYLNTGVDINQQDGSGYTALMLAAGMNKLSTVKLLLGRGADPNLPNKYGFTALSIASAFGNLEVVQTLLGARAEVDPVTRAGTTPLFVAIGMDHTKVALALITAGADPNKRTLIGVVPLTAARRRNNQELIRLLVSKGARE